MTQLVTVCGLVIALASCARSQAQTQPPRQRTAPLVSPEVATDGKVTFRLRAPNANSVALHGEWTNDTIPMTKDEGGNWSVTVGPLPSEVYAYSFTVDGLGIGDPQNPTVKLAARGAAQSLVAIPGNPPRLHDPQNVPHGTVQENWYYSNPLNHELRHFYVYAPPGYDARNSAGYPVLVLLHGAGNAETNWESIGRANFILDNLIAQKRAKPMLLVMPFGHAVPQNGPDQARNNELFEDDLLTSVMPALEKQYRVASGARNRAVAGLSMGGMQALAIGLHHPELFSWVGVYSPIAESDFATRYAAQLSQATALNQKLALVWIGCGTADNLFKGAKMIDETLTQHGIKHQFHPSEGGRHTWVLWREYLEQMAPMLFR
ncbi:MAG TPA: alpha/beta hydrolase-fold protein [Bryobacteraceae bacterium]|nr:alpha/beta hydrolase-fold protein [Bryobacteraceae bacterium]